METKEGPDAEFVIRLPRSELGFLEFIGNNFQNHIHPVNPRLMNQFGQALMMVHAIKVHGGEIKVEAKEVNYICLQFINNES